MPACSSCGNEEPEGARFCGSCGAAVAPAEAPAEEATPPPEFIICASCGSEEPAGAQFCGACGAAFAADDGVDATDEWAAPTEPVPEPPPTAVWTPAPAAEPVHPPERPPRRRRLVERRVWAPAVAILAVAAVVAALFGTGVVGGAAHKSEQAFVDEVNDKVLGPLGLADAAAAGHANGDSVTWASDGQRIVQAANSGWSFLRGLDSLSDAQKTDVQLLLGVVAANRGYGQALTAFTPDDAQGALALEGAAAAARSAIALAGSRISGDLRLPSQSAILTAPEPPPTTTTSVTTTAVPPQDDAGAYVGEVDALLRSSHAVVLSLRSFVRRATADTIDRAAAVALARSLAAQRRAELREARYLAAPAGFEVANELLIRSFEASLADDEALVAWAVARRDGTGNARAAFARANRLGVQATAVKRRFLREYGLRRQIATGLSRSGLPKDF